MILLLLTCIVVALIAHEAGHALMAQTQHLPWRLVINRRGIGIRYGSDHIRLTRRQVRLVAAGGPLASFVLAVVAYQLHLGFLCLTSLELLFWNLVLPNSDGWHIVRPGRVIRRALLAQKEPWHFSSEPSNIFDDVRKAQKAL